MSSMSLVYLASGVLVLAAALFGRNPHPQMWWEWLPAYGALFGYGGAWALVLLAKSTLAPMLRRDDERIEDEA